MASLQENIDRGFDAIVAARTDDNDVTTQAVDTIVDVAHAGLHLARLAADRQPINPGADGDTDAALAWFDKVVADARIHFEAEQNGETS